MIEYIFLCIFVAYVGALLYIKMQSPFWFHHPVHHIYMIYPRTFGYWSRPYRLKPVSQISKPNLYSDFFHVHTYSYVDLNTDQKQKFLRLLQAHYVDSSEAFLYDISVKALDLFHSGQKHPSFVSMYFPEKLQETRTATSSFALSTQFHTDPVACMTSHCQYIWFLKWHSHIPSSTQPQQPLPPSISIPIYVWDYICTHPEYRDKQISRNVIQTHVSRQYTQVPSVDACIFKKEVTTCSGVVPLVIYPTYTFFIRKTPISKLPLGYKIKRIESRTINAWIEWYTEIPQIQSYFDVCLMPSLSNTTECIEKETHYVLFLVSIVHGKETMKGLYIFKDMYTVWDQPDSELPQKRTIQCVSSVCFDMSETLYFFRGFLHCIKELYYLKRDYGVLSIEHNSHNYLLLERWKERYPMHMSTSTAYYLYNYVYPQSPISAERFFTFG